MGTGAVVVKGPFTQVETGILNKVGIESVNSCIPNPIPDPIPNPDVLTINFDASSLTGTAINT